MSCRSSRSPKSYAVQLTRRGVAVTIENSEKARVEWIYDSKGNVIGKMMDKSSSTRVKYDRGDDSDSDTDSDSDCCPSSPIVRRALTPNVRSSGLLRPSGSLCGGATYEVSPMRSRRTYDISTAASTPRRSRRSYEVSAELNSPGRSNSGCGGGCGCGSSSSNSRSSGSRSSGSSSRNSPLYYWR